ncbi:winged helix-turn-helix transcriptional regulator [Nocardia sp. NBC_01388]|uniref:winged helix-turn-helix transcriptional regulator n=1 Tax=Nocardia sp. NBC_01388 TaxID=2903596 RepID=UPI003866AD9A
MQVRSPEPSRTTPRGKRILLIAQLAFGAWLLFTAITEGADAWHGYGNGRPHSPLYGIWREWTDPSCPVARTADLVGDRWSLLIVRDAMDGASSFTDFQQRLGIARNILTDRLRKLVDRGILTTSTLPGGKRHSYELTAAGQDLFTVIVALRQ